MTETKKALEDIRVLDVTQFLAGPYAGMILADMGAEVIKVENPWYGDFTRKVYPKKNDVSMYFENVNRNKKSVTLNLKEKEDKEKFKKLAETADVIIENNRPGVMEKLGLSYEKIRKVNSKIIYASISGFGQYGPYKNRPGYDIISQAMGGAMSITGWPENPPTRSGIALGDILGGMNATIGILSALNNRNKTGVGQYIDVSLVDSIVSSLETITMLYTCSGILPERTGNRYLAAYPYDSFIAKDGHYVIACGTDKHFELLAELMEKPELAINEKFINIEKRKENADELKYIINDWGKDKTVNEIVELILNSNVPAAPIYNIKEVYEDEHISKAREMFINIDHPEAGKITLTGCPIKMSETPLKIRNRAPKLGEHNKEIIGELYE